MSMARVRGPGHPDVACDLVAAAIVQEYVKRDPLARLNVHVTGGRGVLFVAGDVQSSADFDVSAVAKRALSACGVGGMFEPFIAFEPMIPGWASGSREALAVTGYATSETPEMVPKAVALARKAARELEHRRTGDADWFWLGSDYEVAAFDGPSPLVVVRAEHLETVALATVRDQIASVLADFAIKVNPAGDETMAGLAHRMGASGRLASADARGIALPVSASGSGFHPSHPLNVGAWLARACARELLAMGKGRAVSVQLAWLPMETKPHLIRVRNERGENLSSLLDPERFDLAQIPDTYGRPSLVADALRYPFDAAANLPWENA